MLFIFRKTLIHWKNCSVHKISDQYHHSRRDDCASKQKTHSKMFLFKTSLKQPFWQTFRGATRGQSFPPALS